MLALTPTIAVAFASIAPGRSDRSMRLFVGYAPWWAVTAAVCLLLASLLWRDSRSVFVGGLCATAALALVTHTVVSARVFGVGLARGVVVNPLATPDRYEARDAPDRQITYDTTAAGPLRMFVWSPGSAAPAPVMLYIHGGGWTSGSPTERASQMRWFADHGWLVLAPEYPLSGPDRHLWDSTVPQVGCAMAWAGANAPELGGDISQLVMAGDSAGGNLALNAAYQAAQGSLASSCGGVPATATRVVALYPVLDPVEFHGVTGELGPDARRMTEQYTGGTPTSVPERYRVVESETYISAAAPRTLLLVPEQDHLVPPQGAYRFAEAARADGVDVTLVRFPYLEHGLDAAPLSDFLYREITEAWLAG